MPLTLFTVHLVFNCSYHERVKNVFLFLQEELWRIAVNHMILKATKARRNLLPISRPQQELRVTIYSGNTKKTITETVEIVEREPACTVMLCFSCKKRLCEKVTNTCRKRPSNPDSDAPRPKRDDPNLTVCLSTIPPMN